MPVKVATMQSAIAAHVHDGDTVAIEGFTAFICFAAAQIDRFGNLNTTVIGDYSRPKVRLPGSGGAGGMRSDHLTVAPPYVVSEAQLGEIVAALRQAIEEVAAS